VSRKTTLRHFANDSLLYPGADSGGGAPGARPPKIGKNMIFWRKIVIFHTKYLKHFRASLGNWKNMI
jgi:hypothetical protein